MDKALVAAKLETAMALLDDGIELFRCRLRREQPALSDADIDERVDEWLNPTPSHLTGNAARFVRLREPASPAE